MKFKKLNTKTETYQNRAVKLGCPCGCPCFARHKHAYYGVNVIALAVPKLI